MKYAYCENCDKAYVRSRIDTGKCLYCGKGVEVVNVKRNRRYYVGYGTMVAGAALMVVVRFLFFNQVLLWVAGIAIIIVGGYFILKGSGEMATEARRLALGDDELSDNQ